MNFRDYQEIVYQKVREALRTYQYVLVEMPTGSGKMFVAAKMLESARNKGNIGWFVAHRKELLQQCSDNLLGLGCPHGRIDAEHKESRAFSTFIVSKDTIARRYDSVKQEPVIILPDEVHLNIDAQIEMAKRFPGAKFVGFTASPQRLDGKPLSGLYQCIVKGPSIVELTERGFLSPLSYYAPPIGNLDGEVGRIGSEYKADELDEFLERNKIFGRTIDHYKAIAPGKPALVFCRTVKAAKETAQRFRGAGFEFYCVDGAMPAKERKMLIDGLTDGRIHGLTNVNIATTGLDFPRVEVAIFLRPTLSRALYSQMVGRILRTFPGKERAIVLDHANLLAEHGHPYDPYEWNWNGREKRKRAPKTDEINLRLCPEIGYMYCTKPTCVGCEHNTTGRKSRAEEIVNCQLREVAPAVPLNKRPLEERAEYVDRIAAAKQACKEGMEAGQIPRGPIADLLNLYDATGVKNAAMKCYYEMNTLRYSVNVPLLAEIARCKKYKPYWVKMKTDDMRKKMKGRK
jgi:superfamily II DNA or RNA helicase